jgi:hypothetical protein
VTSFRGEDRRWLSREDEPEPGAGSVTWVRATERRRQAWRLERLSIDLIPERPRSGRSRLKLELMPRRSDSFTVMEPEFIRDLASSGMAIRVTARPRPHWWKRTRLPPDDRGSDLSCTILTEFRDLPSSTRKLLLQHHWSVKVVKSSNSLARLGPLSFDLEATEGKLEDANLAMLALLHEATRTLELAGASSDAPPALTLALTFIQGERPSEVEITSLVVREWAEANLTVELNTFG